MGLAVAPLVWVGLQTLDAEQFKLAAEEEKKRRHDVMYVSASLSLLRKGACD
jgi:hypothetical protein